MNKKNINKFSNTSIIHREFKSNFIPITLIITCLSHIKNKTEHIQFFIMKIKSIRTFCRKAKVKSKPKPNKKLAMSTLVFHK